MKLTFTVPELSYSAKSIAEFLCMSKASKGSCFLGMGAVIHTLYPELIEKEIRLLSQTETAVYISERLRFKYEKERPLIMERSESYQACWDEHAPAIEAAFGEIFGVDTSALYNRMLARVNMNPIGPRFLKDKSFDIIYLYSGKGAIYVAMHEITHFLWFDIWQRQFHDSPARYDQPHLPWIFSELAIDAVLSDERLNRYIFNEKQAKMPAYPEFYEMSACDGPLTETFRKLYRKGTITDFMREGYAICQDNQAIFTDYFG